MALRSCSALERLFELAVVLTGAMDQGLAERGLTRARAEVIWRLHRQGPLMQRQLSQALRCTPRNVTDLVDALEAAGLVTRSPHPTDRRATLVSLTEQGKAAASRIQGEYGKLAASVFADLSESQLATFVGVVNGTLQRLRRGPGQRLLPGDRDVSR